jgi:hypothetical protein
MGRSAVSMGTFSVIMNQTCQQSIEMDDVYRSLESMSTKLCPKNNSLVIVSTITVRLAQLLWSSLRSCLFRLPWFKSTVVIKKDLCSIAC